MIGPVNTGGGGDASAVAAEVGDLENLPTTDKSSIVAALTEINNAASNAASAAQTAASTASAAQRAANTNTSAIGALEDLQTTDKSSIVAAINEIAASGGSSKREAQFTTDLSGTSIELGIGESKAVTCTWRGDGTLSAASSNTSTVTVSVGSTSDTVVDGVACKTAQVTLTGGNVAENTSATVTLTLSQTTEYYGEEFIFTAMVMTDLNSMSWAQIQAIASAGTGANYFDVGDTKTITLNGTVGTLALNSFSCKVFILDFNYRGDNGIYFGGFKSTAGVDIALCDSNYGSNSTDGTKYFNMNHWGNNNYGGWKGCDLRYDILGSTDKAPSDYGKTHTTSCAGYDATSAAITSPVANTLMAALPADLRAVLAAWTIYSDNKGNHSSSSQGTASDVTASIDYLPLLSEFEVQGARTYANQYEQNSQSQMAYYANGNSKIKYKHSDAIYFLLLVGAVGLLRQQLLLLLCVHRWVGLQ